MSAGGSGAGPGAGGILYLHGFASGPGSKKGTALAERFDRLGVPFERADLTPGADGFERSSPLTMLHEAERLVGLHRPRFLMGSSLGGYLAALVASRLAGVERLVLLAPAFRLAARWRARTSPEEERRWRAEGLPVHHFASGRERRLAWKFMEDAAGLPEFPEVRVPALCLAGRRDELVPLADVEAFVARTPSARLVVLEDGHELLASVDRIFEEARMFLGA
jgi:alpha-beta hydrolase superfamily lysophospholipase